MRGVIQTIAASFLYSSIGPLVRFVGDDIPILTLGFYRVFFGFLTLLLICPFIDKKTFRIKRSDLKHFIAIGFLSALCITSYCGAMKFTSISNTILLSSTFIFFVPPIAAFFLKEKFDADKAIGIGIATLGIIVINPASSGNILGNSLAFINALSYSFLLVYMRYIDKDHGIGASMWYMLFASIFMLPFAFGTSGASVSSNFQYLFGLGVIITGFGTILINKALSTVESETVSIVMYICSPIIGISVAFLVLNEQPAIQVLYGSAFLLAAGVYLALSEKTRHAFAAPVLHHLHCKNLYKS